MAIATRIHSPQTAFTPQRSSSSLLLIAIVIGFLGAGASRFINALISRGYFVEQAHGIGLGDAIILQFALVSTAMLLAWRVFDGSAKALQYLLIGGIASRLILLGVEPYASNDVLRYLFDGRIALEGFDPYQTAHNLPALAELRAQWQPPPEHAKYPTLYPPLAIAFFSLAASVGQAYAQSFWQLILTTASITSLWLMKQVLCKAGLQKHFALVALSPLLILEGGAGLHLDALATLAVCAALYCWQRERTVLLALVLGLGGLIKILPLALLPIAVISMANWAIRFKLVTITALTVASGYGICLAIGYVPIGSIGTFFDKWRFGAPIFNVFSQYGYRNYLIIVAATAAAIGIAALWLARPIATCKPHIEKQTQQTTINAQLPRLAFASAMLMAWPLWISPVSFPWYLMPLVPLLALSPRPSLLLWLCISPISYEVLNNFHCCQQWHAAVWPLWLIGSAMLVFIADSLFVCFKDSNRKQHLPHPNKGHQHDQPIGEV